MSVSPHGKGKWRVHVDIGRDPVSRKRLRRTEVVEGPKWMAKQKEAEFNALKHGKGIVDVSTMTLQQWFDRFIEMIDDETHSPNTGRFYRFMWKRVSVAFGMRQVRSIDKSHVISFMDQLRTSTQIRNDQKKISSTTILSHYRFLRRLLHQAVYHGIIPYNPCDAVEAPRKKPMRVMAYTVAETKRLMTALDNEPLLVRVMISTAIYSGLRRGEMLGLRWCDIQRVDDRSENPDKAIPLCLIRVERTAVRVNGVQLVKAPKTPGSIRVIGLPEHIYDLLQTWRAEFTDAQEIDFVFRWPDTGRWLSLDYPTRLFKSFLSRHHDLPKLRYHSTRHTYASLLLASGYDWEQIRHLLGHAQASTTLNTYGHLVTDPARTSGQQINQLLSQTMSHEKSQSCDISPNSEAKNG